MGRARVWYQRAAEQGNVKAMHNLAVLSAGRENGTPDYPAAARWFRDAAERNLPDSQFNIGVLHESGLGVEKNTKQAYKWFTLAAAGGDMEAARRREQLRPQLAPADLVEAEAMAKAFTPAKVDQIVNDARAAGEDWKKRQTTDSNG
jgi:localization factor PodJL